MASANTIQSKAMLVKLYITSWTAKKYDRKVSDKIAEEYQAKTDAGRYNKALIAHDEINKIIKIAGEARSWNYDNTLPWKDDGVRILPAVNYLEYCKQISKFAERYNEAVKEFVKKYPSLVEEARKRLGDMFDPNDYPEASTILRKYSIVKEIRPIPSSEDFRVSLQNAEVKKVQKEIDDMVKLAVEDAMKDLWNRLRKVVENLLEKTADKDAVFRDSLVENIVELVEIMPKLNITGDTNLEKIRKEIETKLCSVTPEQLRKDDTIREKIADSAKDILETMAGYMGGE